MFARTSITSLDALANWDTSNVTDMRFMFAEITPLIDASGVDNWDVNAVEVTAEADWIDTNYFYGIFNVADGSSTNPVHPEFTKRSGTWDSYGTFIPSDRTITQQQNNSTVGTSGHDISNAIANILSQTIGTSGE